MTIVTDAHAPDDKSFAALRALLPLAVEWAEAESRKIRARGRPLAFWQIAEARQAGVRAPEKVRIVGVDALPEPADSRLGAALAASSPDPESAALTFGHGIVMLRTRMGERRILRRALRQVAQYEAAGYIGAFLAPRSDRPRFRKAPMDRE